MESASRTTSRQRRTQAQRRDEMQRQLLEATVACLSESGYHGTTTLAVEQRAGVSRGARIHHFPTKAALLAGVANHLLDQIAQRYDEAFSATTSAKTPRARARRGLNLLCAVHRQPEYVALLELSMAARTDEELRKELQAVAEHQRELAVAAISTYFPSLSKAVARSLVDTVHATMVGLIMRRNVELDSQDDGPVITHLETIVVSALPAD